MFMTLKWFLTNMCEEIEEDSYHTRRQMFEHDVKIAYHRVQSVHVHVGGGGTW